MPHRVFIGLGGNLGDPPANLQRAIAAIDAMPGTGVLAQSRLYRSPAWGGVPQPDFTNAVIEIRTGLRARELLRALLDLELSFGRDRRTAQRWGPRPLDCDILLYGNLHIDDPDLRVPHPRIAERAFVLLPLLELAPDLLIPGLGRILALAAALDGHDTHPLQAGFPHVQQ